jgi:hypothetical protein
MGPCIISLKHEVMAANEWHRNGPQDLVTVSLCIQMAIDKMQLCSLSVAYACPYHNRSATMGHSVHDIDIRKPLTHTTPYMLSAICPVQLNPGFIREVHTSPVAIKGEHLPTEVGYNAKLQSGQDLVMMTKQMSFPETVSDSVCRNS